MTTASTELLRLQHLAVVFVDLGLVQLAAEAFLEVGDLPGVEHRRWPPKRCRPAAGPSRGSAPSARRSRSGPGWRLPGWPLLRPTPVPARGTAGARRQRQPRKRVFKRERRVICECLCMCGWLPEGKVGRRNGRTLRGTQVPRRRADSSEGQKGQGRGNRAFHLASGRPVR